MRFLIAPVIAALRACSLLAFCGLVVPATVHAYTLEGPHWPSNKSVVMYLQLGDPSQTLADGSTSWNDVAASALAIWNPCLGSGVQFSVATTTIPNVRGDRKNSVFFSDNAYGASFGPDILALTLYSTTGGTQFVEADVVVNNAHPFDSYRGPLRADGPFDLRRALLHEFGHVLGLDHVDPSVVAVMTPLISSTDTIQADDIAGVQSIYGAVGGVRPVITSSLVASGISSNPFQYQIAASNAPISYYASGLPTGLSINTSTGLISGIPSVAAGIYDVTLTATNAAGPTTAALVLTLRTDPSATFLSSFFDGEVDLGGSYFLTFPNGNYFGSYGHLSVPHYIYHFDMGYEYVFDADDGQRGAYFYDFHTGGFFYSSPTFAFPYLYDFSLNSVVYYYPDPTNPGHYNTNGYRFFYVFNTGQIIWK